MIARGLLALALLLSGMLAVLDVGGTGADIVGILVIGVALLIFDRAVFGAIAASADRDERTSRTP